MNLVQCPHCDHDHEDYSEERFSLHVWEGNRIVEKCDGCKKEFSWFFEMEAVFYSDEDVEEDG